jgi:hypothetical protein
VSRFDVLRARTQFLWYRWRPIQFSYFSLPDMILAVRRVSDPVFMFCPPRLIFGGTEGIRSRFHVFRSRTYFWRCGVCQVPFSCFALPTRYRRYRGRHVPFSCFARPNLISAEPMSSAPVFMFCVPGLVFDGSEGVGSRFHASSARLIFDSNEGVRSRFHFLRTRTRFLRC